jgi:hypothetical protein
MGTQVTGILSNLCFLKASRSKKTRNGGDLLCTSLTGHQKDFKTKSQCAKSAALAHDYFMVMAFNQVAILTLLLMWQTPIYYIFH